MEPAPSISGRAARPAEAPADFGKGRDRRTRNIGTALVLAHLAVSMAHGSAHSHLGIGLSAWQKAFVGIIITAGPLVAMSFLWTRLQRVGTNLLGWTMAGSLIFGLYYHFIMPGADNALGLAPGEWSIGFFITSVLLAVIEAWACVWAGWISARAAFRE